MPSKEVSSDVPEPVIEQNQDQSNPIQDEKSTEGISKPNSVIAPPTTTAKSSPKQKKPWAGF